MTLQFRVALRRLPLVFALAGCFASSSPLPAASVNFYAGTSYCDSSGCAQNFSNNGLSATINHEFDTLPGDVYRVEQTFASADLPGGKLHAKSNGYILDGGAPGTTQFFTLSQAFVADTFTAKGALNGANLYATLKIDGSLDYTDVFADSTVNNGSFVEIYFDPVGSLDGGAYNPIAAYFWGLGPNASTDHPANATFMGVLSDLSGPITLPVNVPFAQLGNSFQVAVGLGVGLYGSSPGGLTWTGDFGNTLQATLSTDPGITLTSEGGFAGTALTSSSVPEPGTAWLMLPLVTAAAVHFVRAKKSQK